MKTIWSNTETAPPLTARMLEDGMRDTGTALDALALPDMRKMIRAAYRELYEADPELRHLVTDPHDANE